MVKTHTIFIHFFLKTSFSASLACLLAVLCEKKKEKGKEVTPLAIWEGMTIKRQQNVMSLALYNSLNTNT